jgi:hypothetical protein
MTEEFKIERGIPVPLLPQFLREKMPLEKMEVGDSFFVSGNKNGKTIQEVKISVRNALPKKTKRRFLCRVIDGGVRVWRVEDRPDNR